MLERGLIRVCNLSADWEYVVKSRLILDVSSVRSESSGGDGSGYVPGADGTGMMAHCGPHEGYPTRGGVLRVEGEDVRRLEE